MALQKSAIAGRAFCAMAFCAVLAATHAMAQDMTIENGVFALDLSVSDDGIPYVAAGTWHGARTPVFRHTGPPPGIEAWAPEGLWAGDAGEPVWRRIEGGAFPGAEASRRLKRGLNMTWRVELVPETALFRVQVQLANNGSEPVAVPWYPAWDACWKVAGLEEKVFWWSALSFVERSTELSENRPVVLGSRLHSSDNRPDGQNPYWMFRGRNGRLFFGIEWCGGWRATLQRQGGGIHVNVKLPPEETQLVLAPGERIAGPVLVIAVTRQAEEREARRDWMQYRVRMAEALYNQPGPWYPFAYNNWYTTRFDLDTAFLERQIEAMDAFGLDTFIIDAGWYKAVGDWTPDPDKFKPGELEAILKRVNDKGVIPGIWSCPQFIKAEKDKLPPEVDQPGFYRKFIDGWLVDYVQRAGGGGTDFTVFLLEHVRRLRERYHAGWWKYDQDFFTAETRHGVMKNVAAFQHALVTVRNANPDLYIENCQSGGRMINELTVLATQNQWIRDGGDTGLKHAESNFREALGALGFLPPWTVNRWTNNIDRNEAADTEFTRMYCRSAMSGTWGIVADLPRIEPRQRDVVIEEVKHYRRLNELKSDCRYDIHPEDLRAPASGIVYYSGDGRRAGLLMLRNRREQEAFVFHVALAGLAANAKVRVDDVDLEAVAEEDSDRLRAEGLDVAFNKERMSALVFIDAR